MLEWTAQQLELSNLDGGPTMPNEITLNPGYPSEQTIEPGAIQVPDLWHLACWLKDLPASIAVIREHANTSDRDQIKALDRAIGRLSQLVNGERAGERVLETWHLAHALKECIRKEAARMPYGPPLAICPGCLAEELGNAACLDVGAAYILATPADCQSMRHPEV